jgi:uncharacterized protein YwqG
MAPVILRAAREAISIETTTPEDYSLPGTSRFGGWPDLPDISHFPTTDELYWTFLAQLNLADLAPLNRYLPRQGLLSFFVNATDFPDGKVLFHPGDPRKLTTVRHRGEEDMHSPDDDYSKKPHRLRFERFCSLPHYLQNKYGDDANEKAYETCKALSPNCDHHINGHVFTQHESPQEQAAEKLRGQPDEWIPLLQLGWDSKVGFCFWDAGTLTFCIHQQDLRRHDFTRIHTSIESS